MARYRFEIARPEEDAAIRHIMASTPMDGAMTLAFQREPNYFRSNCVLGSDQQTILCRDMESGQPVGLATRSVRELFVGGQRHRVGYLRGLRFITSVRRRGLLSTQAQVS